MKLISLSTPSSDGFIVASAARLMSNNLRLVQRDGEVDVVGLTRLAVELRADREDWRRTVKEFALHLCMIPAPLCGSLQLVSYDYGHYMLVIASAWIG